MIKQFCYIDKNDFKITDEASPNSFKCDINIAPIVIILNKKGYITEYCCEGHYLKNGFIQTYILFSEDKHKKNLIKHLPNGFKHRIDTFKEYNRIHIEKIVRHKKEIFNENDFIFYLKDTIESLLKWANDLPNVIKR